VECGVGVVVCGAYGGLVAVGLLVLNHCSVALDGWAPGNELGAEEGAAALAGALGKLVNLTRLSLECTWNVEWAVSCVYVVLLAVQAARLCD